MKQSVQLDLGLDLLGPVQKYIGRNKARYREQALRIVPNMSKPEDVWNRITFSILSANTPFDTSVRGLNYAIACFQSGKELQGEALSELGAMVNAKADYINELPRDDRVFEYLKGREGWHSYRMRLKDSIKGLGIAKASFTGCLLYPEKADLACVDTWVQKVFLGRSGFKTLGVKDYLTVENKIRALARENNIHTFLAQWLIWDYRRGELTNHDIFPGAHKIAA